MANTVPGTNQAPGVSIYSRYYGLDTLQETGAGGNSLISLVQRLLPPPESYPDGLVHTVIGGETLDQLAARYYGREDAWWRIADANPGRFPLDWQPGEELAVPPIRVATRTPRR
jgi:phage tail protein X